MKASKFTDAQKAFIIKQAEDGTSVAEVCRKAENMQSKFRKDLIATGVYAASALRASARDGGVPRIGEFIDGYLLMAMMLNVTEAGEGDFIEIFTEEIKHRRDPGV